MTSPMWYEATRTAAGRLAAGGLAAADWHLADGQLADWQLAGWRQPPWLWLVNTYEIPGVGRGMQGASELGAADCDAGGRYDNFNTEQ